MILKNTITTGLLALWIFMNSAGALAQSDQAVPLPDFTYLLSSGEEGRLYALPPGYTLLYLNHPDCDICKQVSDSLAVSPVIAAWVDSKELSVLGLFPEGDTVAWKAHPTHLSPAWINACDINLSVITEDRYDVKRIPSLYLLDRQKRFLLKDCSVKEIDSFLSAGKK